MRRRERLLKGLYVFCLLEGEEEPRALQALLKEMGLPCANGEAIGEATHIFTHRVWQMKLWHFAMLAEPDGEWLEINDALMADARAVQDLPLPTAMKAARKAALALLDGQVFGVSHSVNQPCLKLETADSLVALSSLALGACSTN